MILAPAAARETAVSATLDDLFRRALARHPDAVALIDPPDRASVTDGAPRTLTYAQADRAIAALAARLRGFGLAPDSVVALQLPNTVESMIALLGVMRAGMIAAPLPLLWRQQEASAALSRAGARALIACRTIGQVDYGGLAMQLAAETFAIRFVAAFGDDLPDGIEPLDDIFTVSAAEPPAAGRDDAADHIALVTFDVTPDGIVAVARSHAELIAGGLAVHLEARIESDAAMLGVVALSSFAAVAATVVPWLLSGGTLALHHPFAPASFAGQIAQGPRALIVPGPLVARLADAGLIEARFDAPIVIALWRAPERLAGSPPLRAGSGLVDVAAFGEVGLVALRRDADGKPSALPAGRVTVPRGATDGIHVLDLARGTSGTLILSGPMVPRAAFPPGIERGDRPRLIVGSNGIDTGYACRLDREAGTLAIDGPPGGMVSVGGYRFALRALQELVEGMGDGALAALPDVLAGQRLAGAGADRDAICDALFAQGANPLLVAAFRARAGGRPAHGVNRNPENPGVVSTRHLRGPG